jgi:Ca-activated chloride channel family protein
MRMGFFDYLRKRSHLLSGKYSVAVFCMAVLLAYLYCLAKGNCSLLTPDQKAYRLFERGEYQEAAEFFADPMWKSVALFKQGEFKDAAGVLAGYNTATAAFNHGNALVMQGKYEEASDRYKRAIELKPGWEAAMVNLNIALARARMLEKKGGEMTGGKLEADEIVFSEGKSPPSAGEEQVEGGQEVIDAELQAVWLRQVQTKPADFLQAKFAYQYAKEKSEQ